jgi:hypothetical protein
MTGCSKEHKISLKKKSDDIGIKVKNGELNRKQSGMVMNGSFIPSIKYSLPAMSFTRKEIDDIQKFTIDKFHLIIGYDHSTHRSLVFGPKEYGGLGIRHSFTKMMEMKINAVLSHIRAKSRLGQAFRININYLQ